jgi:DNA adenine methylase
MHSVDRGEGGVSTNTSFPKPSTLSPFRYPGGKSRFRARIIDWVRSYNFRPSVFVEPFAGGGSVSLAMAELNLTDRVVLAELDPDVASVWKVIMSTQAVELSQRIRAFSMNRKAAIAILEGEEIDPVSQAFRCLLRNRVQRGGIMAPGAGLLNSGENGNGISSRWYAETLASRIESIQKLRGKIDFIEGDGIEVLASFRHSNTAVAFIDPPYFAEGKGAGKRLYRLFDVSAERVFYETNKFSGPAMLTYHRSALIRRLADANGMSCHQVGVRTTHDKLRRELLILKKPKTTNASLPPKNAKLGCGLFTPSPL